MEALNLIRCEIATLAAAELEDLAPEDPDTFLNGFHTRVLVDTFSDVWLAVFHKFNGMDDARPRYFALARQARHWIIENDRCMQRLINLSIHLPEDDSSLLHIHVDILKGGSPSKFFQWIPLVDCHARSRCLSCRRPRSPQ